MKKISIKFNKEIGHWTFTDEQTGKGLGVVSSLKAAALKQSFLQSVVKGQEAEVTVHYKNGKVQQHKKVRATSKFRNLTSFFR
jgi:hypothetical protein